MISYNIVAVYSKNRTFRLWLSSKLGKTAIFKPGDRPTHSLLLQIGPFNFFLYSLVCATPISPQNTKSFSSAKVPKCHLSFSEEHVHSNNLSVDLKLFKKEMNPKSFRQDELVKICNKSPFPRLDNFILMEAMAKVSTERISIRKCRLSVCLLSGGVNINVFLLYDLNGYRYCGRINREHKSNHVQIVVEFHGPIHFFLEHSASIEASARMYSKCLDSDCIISNYKPNYKKVNVGFFSLSTDFLNILSQKFETQLLKPLPNVDGIWKFTFPDDGKILPLSDPFLVPDEDLLLLED